MEILFWVFGGVSMTAVLVMLVWVRWLFDKPEKAGAIIRRAHDGVWKCKMMGLLGMWGYLGFSFCGFKGMLFVLSGAPLVNFLTPSEVCCCSAFDSFSYSVDFRS